MTYQCLHLPRGVEGGILSTIASPSQLIYATIVHVTKKASLPVARVLVSAANQKNLRRILAVWQLRVRLPGALPPSSQFEIDGCARVPPSPASDFDRSVQPELKLQ